MKRSTYRKVNSNVRRDTRWLQAVSLVLVFVLMQGCGKKEPPVPPRQDRPPAVDDLSFDLNGDTVELSWTIPSPTGSGKSPIVGFLIYRSKLTLESDCPNCPKRYSKVGEMSVRLRSPEMQQSERLTFTQAIELGYQYLYMVRAYDDEGLASKDSNVIDFIY